MSQLEEKINELMRKGDLAKVNFLKKLREKILDSQIRRIQENDKTVLKEIICPKWLNWDLLYLWAIDQKVSSGEKKCVFCMSENSFGINYNGKHICEKCFMEIKNL